MNPANVFKFNPLTGNQFKVISESVLEDTVDHSKFYISPKPTVFVIIRDADKILLVRRAIDPYKGAYDLPGGFIDINEDLISAARRELKEELGIDKELAFTYLNSYPSRYLYGGVDHYLINFCLICEIAQNTELEAMDDVAKYEWRKLHELVDEKFEIECVGSAIRDYINSVK